MFQTSTNESLSCSFTQRIRASLRRFHADTRGASFIEYVIVVGLVAIVAIAAFTTFGQSVTNKLTEETNRLDSINVAQ